MKLIFTLMFILLSGNALVKCEWSLQRPILNNNKLNYQVCDKSRTIQINNTEVKPNIPFKLIYPDCTECNSIWSVLSPDNKTAVVYIENLKYQRNAWVVNLSSGLVELFTDVSTGKHFIVKFSGNNDFSILHVGMGYRTDYFYSNEGGLWLNTGHEKVKVE